jgi:hypothetical protein
MEQLVLRGIKVYRVRLGLRGRRGIRVIRAHLEQLEHRVQRGILEHKVRRAFRVKLGLRVRRVRLAPPVVPVPKDSRGIKGIRVILAPRGFRAHRVPKGSKVPRV